MLITLNSERSTPNSTFNYFSSSPKEALCLGEIGPMVLEKKIFKFRHCTFDILLLLPLGKELDPSSELPPLHGWNIADIA